MFWLVSGSTCSTFPRSVLSLEGRVSSPLDPTSCTACPYTTFSTHWELCHWSTLSTLRAITAFRTPKNKLGQTIRYLPNAPAKTPLPQGHISRAWSLFRQLHMYFASDLMLAFAAFGSTCQTSCLSHLVMAPSVHEPEKSLVTVVTSYTCSHQHRHPLGWWKLNCRQVSIFSGSGSLGPHWVQTRMAGSPVMWPPNPRPPSSVSQRDIAITASFLGSADFGSHTAANLPTICTENPNSRHGGFQPQLGGFVIHKRVCCFEESLRWIGTQQALKLWGFLMNAMKDLIFYS